MVLGVVICGHREDHDDSDVGADGVLNCRVMMKMLLIVMVVMLNPPQSSDYVSLQGAGALSREDHIS